jgi:hypothetical protein
MPIPNPKKKEKESDYMGRCMPAIKDEFTSQDQRIAVCLTKFRKGKKQKAKAMEIDMAENEVCQNFIKKLHEKAKNKPQEPASIISESTKK